MKSNKSASILVFLLNCIILIIYLFSIRWNITFNVSLFWVAILSMIGIVFYQIYTDNISYKWILIEIIIISLLFHLIYQIPYYGLRGSDAYADMHFSKLILDTGYLGFEALINPTYSYWPTIHVLGAQISLIIGLDIYLIVKWLPSIISTAIIPALFLLMQKTFRNTKVSLLSCLLFASLQQHILFGSLFIRESIAIIFMIFCLYTYFSSGSSLKSFEFYLITFLFLILTVISHHLTSFMLLTFVSIYFIFNIFNQNKSLKKYFLKDFIIYNNKKINITFLILIFVIIFTYWVYVSSLPLYTISGFIQDIAFNFGTDSYSEIATLGLTPRSRFLLIGFFLFNIIFGLILLYRLISSKKNNLETYSFTIFLFLCGLVSIIYYYFIGAQIYPDRFITFGWLFGFGPLVLGILSFKNIKIKKIGMILVFGFILFNIYSIEPTAWDLDYNSENFAPATSFQDYSLVNTMQLGNNTTTNSQNIKFAFYNRKNLLINNRLIDSNQYNKTHLLKFEYIISDKKALKLDKESYNEPKNNISLEFRKLSIEDSFNWNKIYDSNNFFVFNQ